MTDLLITVRFLDDRFHGLLDRGGPTEWPPSPFRLFRALLAGVARRGELVEGDDLCHRETCKAERKHRGTAKPDEPAVVPGEEPFQVAVPSMGLIELDTEGVLRGVALRKSMSAE